MGRDELFYAKIGVVAVLIAAAGMLLIHEKEVWDNPWAHMTPPLLDHWSGGTTTAGGTHITLDLILTRIPRTLWSILQNSQSDDRDMDGRAMLCDDTGRRQIYQFQGSLRDADGTHTLLMLQAPPHEPPGLRFATLNLAWDGKAVLTAYGWLQRLASTGSALISMSDADINRPVKLDLHRTAGVQLACG